MSNVGSCTMQAPPFPTTNHEQPTTNTACRSIRLSYYSSVSLLSNQPTTPMLQRAFLLAILFLSASILQAQTDLSFRGVRIGMTRAQVEKLVRTSRWEFYSKANPNFDMLAVEG